MQIDLSIAPLQSRDIAPLTILINSAYRGESSKKGWTTEADLLDGLRTNEQALREMTQNAGATILVARNADDQLTGCVYLQKQDTKLYLGMLTVLPDIQAKGIGQQLLTAAENYARKNLCNSIIMTVIDLRFELIAWYKRKGYQSTGEIRPFPANPEFGIPRKALQFIVLEKKLG